MLRKLSITNFALIEHLEVSFSEGFSIITGETGAGKSILLGALGLVLGKRAYRLNLKDVSKKCIIEAEFEIDNYNLQFFFQINDLDYQTNSILRREILPNGKSRSFINDTPVPLSLTQELGEYLVDVHSQYKNLELSDFSFQFEIIDTLSSNQKVLDSYCQNLKKYQKLKDKKESLLSLKTKESLQNEFNIYLLDELDKAQIKEQEQEKLEAKVDKLNHVEQIKASINKAIEIGNNESYGLVTILDTLKTSLLKISDFDSSYKDIFKRIESMMIELLDILNDLDYSQQSLNFDLQESQRLNDRLGLIYSLQKKHSVKDNLSLLQIKEDLKQKVYEQERASDYIEQLEVQIEQVCEKLDTYADELHEKRKYSIEYLKRKLEDKLAALGMENARFKIKITKSQKYNLYGKDELKILFSANKGGYYQELNKVASGGEISRIMLSIKSILSEHSKLPTIIFDEIDTGISGEVSNQMSEIMKQMSNYMQVITITHLPQVASKGTHHYIVYKEVGKDKKTSSTLKKLEKEERIYEIAQMLAGKDISLATIAHARELLK